MRVTHIAPTTFGHDGIFGGGERYPLELCRALARAGIDCELITFGQTDRSWQEPDGLRFRVMRPLCYLHDHPAHPIARGIPRAVAGADVVHVHHMRSMPSEIAAVSRRVQRAPVVVTDHGLQGWDWAGRLPRLYDRFLSVSDYSAHESGAVPERTRVIFGGADPSVYFPDPSETRDGVLFVGRLTPHKGVDRLIAALPGGASLRVVGTAGHDPRPPESGYPALLQRLAAGKDVRFLGAVDDADLPLLYRRATVLVLPSVQWTCYGREVAVSELLGLVLLEAMASGTPVIASRIGGLPEIVEDGVTGFLVEPGNVTELRDRLALLLGDPARARRMGIAARERVIDRFTWRACAERCISVYEELLKPDGTG